MATPSSFCNTLPLTASPEEMFLARWQATMPTARALAARYVRVALVGMQMNELGWLKKVLEGFGFRVFIHCGVIGIQPWEQAEVILYVCTGALEEEDLLQTLLRLAHNGPHQSCPWIVLADFADPAVPSCLESLGVTSVLPKPVFVWDLLETIQTVLPGPEVRGPR